MKVKVKLINPDAQLPVYKTEGAVAADLHTLTEIVIKPGETAHIPTGLAFEIPAGHFLLCAPRSSLSLKKYLDMPNSIGILDEDFRGELVIFYRNLGTETVVLEKGERFVQVMLMPYLKMEIEEAEELSDTDRGTGGVGSTGKF